MVVRESCPTALFWPKEDLHLQPSTQCKYLVKGVRNRSGKYCIQKFRKKISLSESSLSFQHTHLSRVAPILEQPPWRTVKQIYCVGEGREAWESQVLLWGHAGHYHRLGINSCTEPCAWPPLTQTRTKPGTLLSSMLQMFMGVFAKHFKKVSVSEACLHILNLPSFQTFH